MLAHLCLASTHPRFAHHPYFLRGLVEYHLLRQVPCLRLRLHACERQSLGCTDIGFRETLFSSLASLLRSRSSRVLVRPVNATAFGPLPAYIWSASMDWNEKQSHRPQQVHQRRALWFCPPTRVRSVFAVLTRFFHRPSLRFQPNSIYRLLEASQYAHPPAQSIACDAEWRLNASWS